MKEVAQLSSGTWQFVTGHMGRFADGCVELRQNDNSMLGTATNKIEEAGSSNQSYGLNLNVDFRQSAAAIGRIPTNYLRKELTTNDDVAISRIIDRSARPCFYQTYPHKSHILLWQIGIVDKEIIINPSRELLKECQMNMFLTGSDDNRILMLEMEGKQISRNILTESIKKGMAEIQQIIQAIQKLSSSVAKPKLQFSDEQMDEKLFNLTRDDAITKVRNDWCGALDEQYEPEKQKLLNYFNYLVKQLMHQTTMQNKIRVDGRALDEVRPIDVSVDLASKLHGSAIFQRGQSQVYATCTFDSPQAAFRSDAVAQLLGAQQKKSFMLNYEFPPFATGEVGESKFGQNRREIGHALLAEKALKYVIPEDFPFTIRISTQVLESNGSTSMAAACAGSLAMLDAGVNLLNPVAGVAIGMFSKHGDKDKVAGDKDFVLLTDLFGMEDHFGEMDFKMAGTTEGFTAMQLDLKNNGLTREQVQEALVRGQAGIVHILNKMGSVISKPREVMKPTVPVIEIMELPPNHRRDILFRAGAYQAKLISTETGVEITAEEEKKICLVAPNAQKLEKAKKMALDVMQEFNDEDYLFGQFYKAEVVGIQDNGVMVTLKPGSKPILLKNSELANQRVGHPSALGLKEGQKITVRYFGRDAQGFHRITCRMMYSGELAVQSHFPKSKDSKVSKA
uniref:polyribonucleotide nucleotidyltransferase n=1 Tax=Ditylenchus dipsaci TaxID=166011 RepID=A0A915EBD7_9BILA